MKKVLAIALSLMLAFPAASLMAQQAPAPAKVQPVQVAYQTGAEGFLGMGTGAMIASLATLIIVISAANQSDSFTPAAGTTTASGTR